MSPAAAMETVWSWAGTPIGVSAIRDTLVGLWHQTLEQQIRIASIKYYLNTSAWHLQTVSEVQGQFLDFMAAQFHRSLTL